GTLFSWNLISLQKQRNTATVQEEVGKMKEGCDEMKCGTEKHSSPVPCWKILQWPLRTMEMMTGSGFWVGLLWEFECKSRSSRLRRQLIFPSSLSVSQGVTP
uniref:Uncharacterized protein n=1 Tax=Taeniopygia guttata TaxID=59729 RepID=A0A674GX94_TAEGU